VSPHKAAADAAWQLEAIAECSITNYAENCEFDSTIGQMVRRFDLID
jgi:hypothetical protein